MTPHLEMLLLGQPQILLSKQPIKLKSVKAHALLIYVALQPGVHSREALAGLLWGEMPEEAARANLRKALSVLRRAVGDFLAIRRRDVQFIHNEHVAIDAHQFERFDGNDAGLVANTRQYRGEFMQGFIVSNAPEFQLWLLSQRERYRMLILPRLQLVTAQLEATHQLSEALEFTNRWLALGPWEELAHRTAMRLLAKNGQAGAAVQQFERCRDVLEQELGIGVSAETEALLEAIKAGKLTPQNRPVSHNLPELEKSFVGRTDELRLITEQLHDPTVRLVTLSGQGGVGKTTLSLVVAHRFVQSDRLLFPDGVFFVPLAAVLTRDIAIAAIASVMDITLTRRGDPVEQLIKILSGQKLLLILDNFEQLVSSSTEFIHTLLSQAQNIKLLITSRQRLRIQQEFVLPLAGLETKAEQDDALCLFEARAKQRDINFDISEQRADVVRICQLVEGLPLAIELAAAWTHVMACGAIADQIETNLVALDDPLQDVRHRNVQAVFEQSIGLLSPKERHRLVQLAIFSGGFSIQAAAAVADCPAHLLLTLVEKSLVQRAANGRYDLHTLLKQFLLAHAELRPATTDAHFRHYLHWIGQHVHGLRRGEARKTYAQAVQDADNLRSAILNAAKAHASIDVTNALAGVFVVWQSRGWFADAIKLCDQMAETFDKGELFGRIQLRKGVICLTHGAYDLAQHALESAIEMFNKLDMARERCQAQSQLSVVYLRLGQGARAVELIDRTVTEQEALGLLEDAAVSKGHRYHVYSFQRVLKNGAADLIEALEVLDAPRQRAQPLNSYGTFLIGSGDYAKAAIVLHESADIMKQLDDVSGAASCQVNLSIAAVRAGELEVARVAATEARAVFERCGEPFGVAVCEYSLGSAARIARDFALADQHFQAALEIHNRTNHQIGKLVVLHQLGAVAIDRGDADALEKMRKFFIVTVELDIHAATGNAVIDSLPLLLELGLQQLGIGLLWWSLHGDDGKPVAEQFWAEQGIVTYRELQIQTDPAIFEQAVAFGHTLTPTTAAEQFLAETARYSG